MIRVGVIGTIGVGKSTFIERLSESFMAQEKTTVVFGEPSIIHGNLNEILRKFYIDTPRWAYSLQLGISAAHDAIFEEIKDLEKKKSNYKIGIVDAPYSSFVYCNIHAKAGRMTEEERVAIDNVSRAFHFDHIILLEESADETIKRIKARNRNLEDLEDLSYMHEHIEDFKLFRPDYIEKYFAESNIVHLTEMPDINSAEYNEVIDNITNTIINT